LDGGGDRFELFAGRLTFELGQREAELGKSIRGSGAAFSRLNDGTLKAVDRWADLLGGKTGIFERLL
jgi:hypothetical protein